MAWALGGQHHRILLRDPSPHGRWSAGGASYFAQANPSAPCPALISFTLQAPTWMAATWWLRSHDTYAIFPSGRISTSCGAAGTVIVFATRRLGRSITATSPGSGTATSNHFPSGVAAEPYPMPGRAIQRSTFLLAASITARRGFVVSDVNTQRSSGEIEIRCTCAPTGITVTVFRPGKSSTDTVPGPTLAVYPWRPSWLMASMCDSACPVGILPAILSVLGSMMLTVLSSSVVT